MNAEIKGPRKSASGGTNGLHVTCEGLRRKRVGIERRFPSGRGRLCLRVHEPDEGKSLVIDYEDARASRTCK